MADRQTKTYTELCSLGTFEERLRYLQESSVVGYPTFENERYINQRFYHSPEWKRIRRDILLRDNGNDLGVDGHPIQGRIIIHHLNPLTVDDIVNATDAAINPEYMISVSHNTHLAIHYSDSSRVLSSFSERRPNDTCPWKV